MNPTGTTCQTTGLYLSTGACGHAREHTLDRGNLYPHCAVCGRKVNWTLLRASLVALRQLVRA